jgi:MraZ protein
VFRGEFSLNLDAKGRLAVPSRYREPLVELGGGRLIATISLMDPCLVVYPLPDWEKIEHQLRNLPALDRKAQTIRQLLIGRAADLELDSHNRVLLPQHLRDFGKLEKRVKMVGQVNNFELWNEATWQEWCADQLARVHTGQLLENQSEALSSLILN